ncbi:MAG TPA: sugar phosphate isomerase/epimerase [Opitutaceae bacterium]|nr:sugar phosphate isomerase/epimerase [Opitutaceae bacterium]
MSKTPLALQLYSVRDDTKQDFARTVAEVAKIGYAGVELAGYGNLDARQAQSALRSAGLAVAGMHVLREALRDNLEQIADEALMLGTTHVICPWWTPDAFTSVASVEEVGRELGTYGERLRERGLLLSFHNHKSEFRLLEGRPVMSWLLGSAAPRSLGAELDVYWAHVADYPPERFLYEQGQRVRLLHLKDEKVIGDGPVNFPPIFKAAETIRGIDWYVVEQENYDDTPLNSVRQCFERAKSWGLV